MKVNIENQGDHLVYQTAFLFQDPKTNTMMKVPASNERSVDSGTSVTDA